MKSSLFFILVLWRYRKAFHGQIFLAWLDALSAAAIGLRDLSRGQRAV